MKKLVVVLIICLVSLTKSSSPLRFSPQEKAPEPTPLPTSTPPPNGSHVDISTDTPRSLTVEEASPVIIPKPEMHTPLPSDTKEVMKTVLVIPALDLERQIKQAGGEVGKMDFSELDNDFPVSVPQYTQPIGLPGITIVLGHRQWGPAPKVFAYLPRLSVGDPVVIKKGEREQVYVVKDELEKKPEDAWSFVRKENERLKRSGKSGVALITCTPYGTNWRRLIVIAEEVEREDSGYPRPQ